MGLDPWVDDYIALKILNATIGEIPRAGELPGFAAPKPSPPAGGKRKTRRRKNKKTRSRKARRGKKTRRGRKARRKTRQARR